MLMKTERKYNKTINVANAINRTNALVCYYTTSEASDGKIEMELRSNERLIERISKSFKVVRRSHISLERYWREC
ncbi:MAG: hypothetical protein ACTS4V_01660 [Candidatus Hodgkinia cicadicola]